MQISSETFGCTPGMHHKLLVSQGVTARAAKAKNRLVRRWAVWLILFTVLALLYVWSRVQVVQLGYDIMRIEGEVNAYLKQVSALEMEVAKLKSPRRLEEVASQRLNMQPPTANQIVLVK